MLSNDYFYFSITRKYIALFGSLFNNIIINRTDKTTGNVTQIISIPIQYSQKEKMLVRTKTDPAIDHQSAIVLPRMSFYLDGITYDGSRKMAATNKLVYAGDANNVKFQYTETPWNYHFSLYVYIKNAEDGTKIIEQILPFFTPEFTVKAFIVPGHASMDVPVSLIDVSHENTDTLKFEDNSVLIWTLHFTLKGSLFGPIKNSPLIKQVNTSIYIGGNFASANTPNTAAYGMSNVVINTVTAANLRFGEYMTIVPGLDANGNPTTLLANSVPANTITGTEDWGEIITFGDLF